jgi:phosphonate transport system permease protein
MLLLPLFVVVLLRLDLFPARLFETGRLENLTRFARDIHPYALRDRPFSPGAWGHWFATLWRDHGYEACAATFCLSVVSIVLAGFSGLGLAFFASRNVATAEPFLPGGKAAGARRWTWKALVAAVRSAFILARAVPEYIWGFLFIAIWGPGAWPAVLALALHNFGILGKLGAETVENADPAAARALRGKGLTRARICVAALLPRALTRWLLFFFYRWESCIREATVMGMLGIASIGFWVRETRARDRYDEMLFYILLGAMLVMLVDLASAVTRRVVRRA